MRDASWGFAKEGLLFIAPTGLCAVVFALLGWAAPALVALALCLFCLYFFRDPERHPPARPELVVAPADGVVCDIGAYPDPVTGESRQRLSIFMNLFNVHVNRMPLAATFTSIEHIHGAFINASLDKASEKNERMVIGLSDAEGAHWTMVQIAGLVARRIVCRAEVGEGLERAQRFGLIRFGSRVDLYLPDGYSLLLQKGDSTVAGETPVAARLQP